MVSDVKQKTIGTATREVIHDALYHAIPFSQVFCAAMLRFHDRRNGQSSSIWFLQLVLDGNACYGNHGI